MATIGKVVAAHGINGEIRVYPYSDFLSRCESLKRVWLAGPGGKAPVPAWVTSAFVHRQMWVLKLEGVDNRQQAEALRDYKLQIPKTERVPLPPGQYYFDQIIGLKVIETDGSCLGTVVDVLQPGGSDLYVVQAGKRQVLIPAVKEVVKEINLPLGQMVVALPPGLKEL